MLVAQRNFSSMTDKSLITKKFKRCLTADFTSDA